MLIRLMVLSCFLLSSLGCSRPPLYRIVDQQTQLMGPEPQGHSPLCAVKARKGMVSSANRLATEAGVEILAKGGNAADAALAIQFMLNVTEPQSSGIGGGAFILYYSARTNKVTAIDGREESPNMPENIFLNAGGKPVNFFPDRITGGHASGVPGTVAAMQLLHEKYGSGRITVRDTLARAVQAASDGYAVTDRLSAAMKFNATRLRKDPYTAQVFLKKNQPYLTGEIFRQRDLAKTLQTLARYGLRYFYEKEFAEKISFAAKYNRHSMGYLTARDIEEYSALEKNPVFLQLGEHTVYTFPPPGSGITLLQTLHLMWQSRSFSDHAKYLLRKIEAEKLAFSDRHFHIEDPDFSEFDMTKLLAPAHLNKMQALADRNNTYPVAFFDKVKYTSSARISIEGDNTTHFSVMDSEGNTVSVTSTIEFSMGAGYAVPSLGFLMNNQLTDFETYPNLNNSYKKGKAERKQFMASSVNAYKSGKKPRSSMTPVIILHGKKAVFSGGSPGGTFIPGVMSHVVFQFLNTQKDIQHIVNEPRGLFKGDSLVHLEAGLYRDQNIKNSFSNRKYAIKENDNLSFGSVQAVIYRDGIFWGATDLRREGLAMGID